jgi:hypothetical protein
MNIASQVKIAALDNRPYLVTGEVLVTDAEGNELRPSGRPDHCAAAVAQRRSRFVTVPIQRSVLRQRRGLSKPYLSGARSSARVDDQENLLRYLQQADLASSEAL